jgi:hypothetical protein
MSRNNKWTYELYNEENWSTNEDFNTKEEAIEAGKEAALDEEEIALFYVGKIVDYEPNVNAYRVVDDLIEDAAEQCGEVSDSFLDNVTKEQYKLLSEILDDVLYQWLRATNNQPNFYRIVNVETIKVKE